MRRRKIERQVCVKSVQQGRWEEGLFLNFWCKKIGSEAHSGHTNQKYAQTPLTQTDGRRWPRAVKIRLILHSKEMRGPRSCAQLPLEFGRWPIVPPSLIHSCPCWDTLSHDTHIILLELRHFVLLLFPGGFNCVVAKNPCYEGRI